MAEVYLRAPDGQVYPFDERDAQRAVDSGYTPVDQAAAREAELGTMDRGEAVSRGLLEAPENYDQSEAFLNTIKSGLTFGQLPSLKTPEARAAGLRFREEHAGQALFGEALGMAPLTVVGGVAGAAVRGAAAGTGLALRTGAVAVDYGLGAAIGGAQIEGEESRLTGEEFSWTDAAVAGLAGEVLGRGANWTLSKAVGGARNLVTRGERNIIAADAERSLTRGGWVRDYQVASHSDEYLNKLAELSADDLDVLETTFAEVSRQDRKRARIVRAVIDNPPVQRAIAVQEAENLRRLQTALADELVDGSGPARRLARHLEQRIAELDQVPRGKKLWRSLDENRQALQEYRQDLHQAYDENPGSAWLSRDGLAAIDQAEESTRLALLREDAWGENAARMQREYNTPFHEQWFPARGPVLKELHFATGKNSEGFTVYRGDPARLRKFLERGTGEVDARRARELFSQYLDGAQAVARAGAKDAPKASRDALEAIRRLRKAVANAEYITSAAARTRTRAGAVGAVGQLAAGVGGLVAAGPVGALGGVLAARGANLGKWLGEAGKKLGWFRGAPEDMAALLARDALPEPRVADDVSEALTDDIFDGPFRPASDLPRPPEAGPIQPQPIQGVGVSFPMRDPPALGVGQARRAGLERPAGYEAIQPARTVDVESVPPGGTPPPRTPVESLGPPDDAPSIGPRGSELDALAEAEFRGVGPTVAAPTHAQAAAHYHSIMGGEAALARRRADANTLALSEGEFREVVGHLRSAGAKTPEGKPMADELEVAWDDLLDEGLVTKEAIAPTQPAPAARPPGLANAPEKLHVAYPQAGQKMIDLFGRELTEAEWEGLIPIKTLEELGPVKSFRLEPFSDGFELTAFGREMADGDYTFKISRTFGEGMEGEGPEVHHDFFYIHPDLQGTGVGARVLKQQMETYKRLGVEHVFVSADQVGRYFWPSIGFDRPNAVPSAVTAYKRFLQTDYQFTPEQAAAAVKGIRSLPALAQAEYGKEFLLNSRGPWNSSLEIRLDDANPLYHLMRGRLDIALAATIGVAGALEASDKAKEDRATQAASGLGVGAAAFAGRVGLFKALRAKTLRDVARRLFSATAEATPRIVARLVYSRAELAQRQQEFDQWASNPAELVDRVAEGFRDVPPEQFADVAAGVYRTAAFLKERLPTATQINAVSMSRIPVSTDAMLKFARYEEAALRPREAIQAAAESGHISTELLETLQELYPDMLAELRVEAYLAVREDGPPPTIQSKLAYAQLFDGDGSVADPSMSPEVATMAAYAYEHQSQVESSSPPAPTQSQMPMANAAPRGLQLIQGTA